MKKYEVDITDVALLDMESIYDYIANALHSPDNALGQYNRISKAILNLDSFPKRFPLVGFEPEHTWNMRKMVVDNYVIFFIVDESKVTVTDVLYSASDLENRLSQRHT